MAVSKKKLDGSPRRLPISLVRGEVMSVANTHVGKDKVVYFLLADSKQTYLGGRSRLVYVGTTKNGLDRIANSVAYRAPSVLRLHGVRGFSVRIATCRPRQRVKTWMKLERAFLLQFREIYGEVPLCNIQGSGFTEKDEFRYFARSRVNSILHDLA